MAGTGSILHCNLLLFKKKIFGCCFYLHCLEGVHVMASSSFLMEADEMLIGRISVH